MWWKLGFNYELSGIFKFFGIFREVAATLSGWRHGYYVHSLLILCYCCYHNTTCELWGFPWRRLTNLLFPLCSARTKPVCLLSVCLKGSLQNDRLDNPKLRKVSHWHPPSYEASSIFCQAAWCSKEKLLWRVINHSPSTCWCVCLSSR